MFLRLLLSAVFIFGGYISAQTKKSENIVVITFDGLRWQEMFGGADSTLSFDTTARYNISYVKDRFWSSTAVDRRKKLLPFFWSEILSKGILLGNRDYGNKVNNANPYWFSYPGYNEIFTGFPDTTVNSNDKVLNPNENIFEFMNKMQAYRGKAAVFASWDVFSFIFNEKRSGVFVNDGFRDVPGKLTEKQELFNHLQHEMPDLFHGPSERLDLATFHMGMEYMKANKPRLMYFAFGDTDEFAHAGLYDYYLDAANKTDAWIRQIWNYIQTDPFYSEKTTLVITTDHGRGAAKDGEWKSHGARIKGASEMWMAMIGNGVPAKGELKTDAQVYQGQLAATITSLLGIEFKPRHQPLPALDLSKQ